MKRLKPNSGQPGGGVLSLYKYSLLIELLVICVIFQTLTGGLFLSTRNLSNILVQGATCSIIAITMCWVLITCNADLSAGRALGFIGMVVAYLQVRQHLSNWLIVIIVAAICLFLGVWHGYWVGFRKLPAFIVTLATQLVLTGITLVVSGGASIGPVSGIFAKIGADYIPNFFTDGRTFNDTSLIIYIVAVVAYLAITIHGERKKLAEGLIEPRWRSVITKMVGTVAAISVISMIVILYQGFSYAMLVLMVMTLALTFVVNNTSFGRYIFAIGGNRDAAEMSGISVEWTTMKIYIIHTLVIGLASLVYIGRVGQAAPSSGTGFEFTAITGCVVGGTSISGGRGNVLGAVIGTMIMAALDNGMSLLNLGASYQYVVKGLVLMFAIAMDVISNEKRAKVA